MTPDEALLCVSLGICALAVIGAVLLRDPNSRLSRRLDDRIDTAFANNITEVLR